MFFENAYLSYDENTRKIIFDKYDNKESDNSGGSVWEWIDVSVDEYLLAYLEEMIKGKSIKMRLDGKYTKTRNLSANEINGIKDVLLAYDVLKNEITNKLRGWYKYDDRGSISIDEVHKEIWNIIEDHVNLEELGY